MEIGGEVEGFGGEVNEGFEFVGWRGEGEAGKRGGDTRGGGAETF